MRNRIMVMTLVSLLATTASAQTFRSGSFDITLLGCHLESAASNYVVCDFTSTLQDKASANAYLGRDSVNVVYPDSATLSASRVNLNGQGWKSRPGLESAKATKGVPLKWSVALNLPAGTTSIGTLNAFGHRYNNVVIANSRAAAPAARTPTKTPVAAAPKTATPTTSTAAVGGTVQERAKSYTGLSCGVINDSTSAVAPDIFKSFESAKKLILNDGSSKIFKSDVSASLYQIYSQDAFHRQYTEMLIKDGKSYSALCNLR